MVDYIIVGAGAAGCVLANRLSENPHIKVLLLEAGGPDKSNQIHIPAAYSQAFKSALDWNFETDPQPYMNNRKLYWPRGKVLGGSTSINAMIYIRGQRRDYDSWRDAGNPGWGFDDVLPYFKKSENQERGASTYHGVGGPLNVADLIQPNPMTQAFVEAGKTLGFNHNPDFNGAEQAGVGTFQVTQKNGKRHSTAAAFLKPVLNRPNLKVEIHAQATRILFRGNRAVGIAYIQNGQPYEAHAEREVILSGGTINSPQLLLLSGVGPAEHLREMGISVLLDLPGVGQNLQDHIAAGTFYYATQPVSLANASSIGNLIQYFLFRRGMLTSNVGEGGAFIKSSPDLPEPDLQYHFGPIHYVNHGLTKMDGHGFATGPVLLQPESRGCIKLRSKDPLVAPSIQPCYLESKQDMERLLCGVKIAREIVHTKPFDAYRGEEILPGTKVQTDEELREYIRNHGETLYHPAGSCKMGNDSLAVVNTNLQVHGLEGLRVVDASIMPTVTSGNTNAPTIMIAEKAADMIKQS